MKQLYFLLFLFSFQLYAQKEQVLILGKVENDSLPIENVHIINLTSNIGTVSNQLGSFKILGKLNDSLQFSNIKYGTKTLIITKKHVQRKSLFIKLQIKINQLKEVIVDNEKNTKGVSATSLSLPNAGKKPLNRLERNLNAYSQESVPIVILMAFLNKKGGIDDIYNIISGNRKKDQKLKKLIDKDQKLAINQKYIQKIRSHFQDTFFINTLHIPKEKINLFIDYCLPKNIIYLFNKKRHVEVIDIFIKEKESFKSTY